MKKILYLTLAILYLSAVSFGQLAYNEEQFRLFDGKGNAVTMEQLVKAMGDVDAVFLGELHDDAVGHAVQAEVFRRVVAQYCQARQCALSLEMFERDVQTVLDEYLAGQISENHFMLSSRPWGNYKTDYRPLVELAVIEHVVGGEIA
ncbi:MAG TPA: ChaN family lipoprotein, partial [Pyrinomonadaceae bacterium]|nr:ChaN family lipoprotein [Pyrinomonadaceae bacterium]